MIEEVSVKQYKCELCGSIYNKKESAENCYNSGNFLKNFAENAKPWHWYHLSTSTHALTYAFGEKGAWKFISHFKIKPWSRTDSGKCGDKDVMLFEAGRSYGISYNMQEPYTSEACTIGSTILSIQEGYERYKLVPHIYDAKYHDQYIRSLQNTPIEIIKEINQVIREARLDELDRLNSMSKDELIYEYTKHAHVMTGKGNVFLNWDLIPLNIVHEEPNDTF